jgi:hypothetical protein
MIHLLESDLSNAQHDLAAAHAPDATPPPSFSSAASAPPAAPTPPAASAMAFAPAPPPSTGAGAEEMALALQQKDDLIRQMEQTVRQKEVP